ncbi:hypothetical protein ACFS7Z_19665 [Pontibacter toksunensis]|uniref:PH domain-containing protein n=1 Tax=Pontibacter toksunensis TaxID=1332631 RepID=A0ABW6C2V7_9BACT
MKKVYSKYKFFGGFGLLIGLNLLIGFASFKLLTASKISIEHVDLLNDSDARFAYTIIIGLNLLFLLLFITQSRFIIVNTIGITFINPLLPLLRKTRSWSDFDYYITVDENSRYSTYEAVWLIKDGKLKGRFSSYYYSNYYEIKSQIKTRRGGKKYFNPFSQFFIILGMKRIKTKPNKAHEQSFG